MEIAYVNKLCDLPKKETLMGYKWWYFPKKGNFLMA